ncbi:tRNA:m(4)X modification enzyme TRM13 homolog [Denticeps clupeoides]|uniref:tRNA:m(4)X modification enzyme TRM13 n=1 Tax=Denticeps clupeoides TaxID=299321 RepID=A0AAY4BDL5_9TELE|nr:tRNA:m(4)X modification enzyme TRM13 homolog [Denticeps clupeoides]
MASVAVADGVSAPLPGRCCFFVEKKRRYCKMVVGGRKTFCGEHANADQDSPRNRIPCPLDPKHTVYEDSLAKHLKKCNAKEKPKPVYYVKDVNAGTVGDEEAITNEVPLTDRTRAELDLLIQKLKNAIKGLNLKHKENILSHPALCGPLSDPKNGDFASKHLKQQASILGNMEALNLLGPNRCVVEFGAGKGKLSHWIDAALKGAEDVHFLLVERSSTRFKVDGKHRSADSTFERLQVDIQHLDLNRVPFLRERALPVVGVGKHLCGTATDLALRCLMEERDTPEGADRPPSKRVKLQDSSPTAVSGVAIALCCHHRCDWRHYVGKEFFRERGLGAAEFSAFRRMSSWATCGFIKGRAVSQEDIVEEEEHEQVDEAPPDRLDESISAEEREHIGRLCKLLIDYGRVRYLRQKGFDSGLCYYTSRDVSLENVLLTAVPVYAQE